MAVQWKYPNPQTDINWQQNMVMIIQGLNPLVFTFHPGGLPINLASLCLQLEKISCLEFRVAWLGLSRMLNFSLVHSLQMPFTGLNRGTFFSKIFHSTVGFLPSSFSFQKWVYRVIFPSSLLTFRFFLCFLNLSLKFWAILYLIYSKMSNICTFCGLYN